MTHGDLAVVSETYFVRPDEFAEPHESVETRGKDCEEKFVVMTIGCGEN